MKIMKTFVRALSVLAGALALTMVVGCDNEPPHECSFSESWTSDEENHWHACVCGEKSGVELHSWNDGEITKTPSETEDGIKTFECKICKARKNIPIEYNHVHSYTVTKSDDVNHWKECSCGKKSGESAHDYEWKYNDTKHWKECKDCGFKGSESDHDEAVLCTCGSIEKNIDQIPFGEITSNPNPPKWLYGTWVYDSGIFYYIARFSEKRCLIGSRSKENSEENLIELLDDPNIYTKLSEKSNSCAYEICQNYTDGRICYIKFEKQDANHFLFTQITYIGEEKGTQGPLTFTKE